MTAPQALSPAKSPIRFQVPISIAGIGAIFYGISMFALAGGNMTTALAVATNVDFVPTIAAMLMRVTPHVIFPLILYIIYRLRLLDFDRDGENGTLLIIAVGLAMLIALCLSSMATLLTCALVFLLHGFHVVSHKKNWRLKIRKILTANTLQQLLCAVFLGALVLSPSWLPREEATISGRPAVVSVIKETDEYVYYLETVSGKVMYAKPADLAERKFCGSGDKDTVASLIGLLSRGNTYPICPKDS